MEEAKRISDIVGKEELKQQLFQIYQKVIQESEKITSKYPLSEKQLSRDNFLSYLILSNMKIDLFEQRLIDAGLSPLGYCEGHVLYSLECILKHLGIPECPKGTTMKPSLNIAAETKRERSKALFGENKEGKNSSIMVTLDKDMLMKGDIFEQLLYSGMDIARINCAHDDQQTWEALVKALRQAEHKTGAKQNCKIYMDLAGPKIRVGKLEQEKHPIKIIVPKDENGHSINKPVGIIDSLAEISSTDGHTFIFAVANNINFLIFEEGDKITFSDVKNRKRILTIINIISPTKIQVELNETALINEETTLILKNFMLKIKNIPTVPVKLKVKKGDYLRIFLNSNKVGKPGNGREPAAITTTFPKAFYNVKKGDNIFINDGMVHGVVNHFTDEYVELEITSSNKKTKIKEGHGINLPDSLVGAGISAVTNQDIDNLPFILQYADMIGISFIHSPTDLQKLKHVLEILQAKNVGVIAKIETKDAIHHLGRIILEGLKFESFGIMIARGDLAVEIGFENLAIIQEEILRLCNAAHIPVIWATQVLEQLTKEGIPTRAEISDAALGKRTECVMLNKGPFIIDAVKVLANLLKKGTVPQNRIELIEESTKQYGIE